MKKNSTKSDGRTHPTQKELVTIKLIPRRLKPFHVRNSESTHEPRRGQLARKREKERVRCQQMPKPAHPPRREQKGEPVS